MPYGEEYRPDRQAARLLAAIVASSDDAIISKSLDGVVTTWNRSAERIFGFAAEEMIGRPISLLASPGHEDEMPGILARLCRGERIDHHETSRRRKDGSTVMVSVTISPIHDDSGRIIGASKVARDITAGHAAAEALKEARAALCEQHRAHLHAARLCELGQMAATLAHEINQPLGAIANYLQGCRRLFELDSAANGPRIEEGLRRAAEQTDRAGEVLRRMRSFAKPPDGAQAPQSISRILEDAVALATIDADRRGVKVDLRPPPRDELVIADRIEIQQVLMNLIRNALEAMERQDHHRELGLAAVAAPETVEVAVSDTGLGLPLRVREHFGEPFVTTKSHGMGIGLSICRKIIESHGGRLWAEDNPSGGTTFRFTLQTAH